VSAQTAITRGAPLSARGKVSLAAEILAAYVRARLAIRGTSLPAAVAALRDPAAGPVPEDPGRAGLRLGRAVVRTLRFLPTDTRCLMRSLVLTRLLARRGIEATFVLGVSRADGFESHAWVEHAGRPLLPPGSPTFERLLEL
jgi:Transglutaminase-like superfamily